MANAMVLTDEEMVVDSALGYPRAYARLCRDRSAVGAFTRGPPLTFTPYALAQEEDSRAKEFDEMFPVIDLKAKPTTKPKIFLNLLWKQLNHLGNAGFDPEIIRVDPYGNVLYYHADEASPLAWDVDHWFPSSRGGLTVLNNLRILQWHVCKKKHDKLEFLIPWWNFQLGVSINQFLSIFASSNSDFRRRAFSLLFQEGESEELNASQTVDSHAFPQHFFESKGKLGLAPAAVVFLSRRESLDAPLKSLDVNRRPRPSTPIVAAKKVKHLSKENQDPMMASNPYQAIVMARDSLKQREETAKMHAEIHKLDNEVGELHQLTEEEKLSIQELELVLMKKRRQAEKCRRLAESQSSYRATLEKMIRDAMHQSVIYKEQVRLNQAAASALMVRLEAQKAICDSAVRDLHIRYKQRDGLEKQMKPTWEDQARMRSRTNDSAVIEKDDKIMLNSPDMQQEIEPSAAPIADIKSTSSPSHKELRRFLEEEQRTSAENSLVQTEEGIKEEIEELKGVEGLEIHGCNLRFSIPHEPQEKEDEESRRQCGKGNIEKWLQFLLENTLEEDEDNETNMTADELIKKLNLTYPHIEIKLSGAPQSACTQAAKQLQEKDDQVSGREKENGKTCTLYKNPPYRFAQESPKMKECDSTGGKKRKLLRLESARGFRRIPSSPSLLLESMKKRVDCIAKKPPVLGDDEDDHSSRNNFIKSSIKTIKRAVRL